MAAGGAEPQCSCVAAGGAQGPRHPRPRCSCWLVTQRQKTFSPAVGGYCRCIFSGIPVASRAALIQACVAAPTHSATRINLLAGTCKVVRMQSPRWILLSRTNTHLCVQMECIHTPRQSAAGWCTVQWLVPLCPACGEVTGEPTCPLYQAGRGGPFPSGHQLARLIAPLRRMHGSSSRRAPLTPACPPLLPRPIR